MRTLLVALTMVAAACTPLWPGTGVTPDFASAWACNADSALAKAAKLVTDLKQNEQYIPHPGWDACDVLAHNGVPTRVEYQLLADGSGHASWWYPCVSDYCSETHLVTLTLVLGHLEGSTYVPNRWVVDCVGW